VRGEPTDAVIVEAFRQDYLYTGNASKSGRKFKLHTSTARDLAKTLSEDPSFVKDRQRLRANAADEAERAVMEVIAVGLKRFKDRVPEVEIPEGSRAPVTIVDKRADYGKLVIDAHRALVGRSRLDAEKSGEIPTGPALVVNMTGATEPGSLVPSPLANSDKEPSSNGA
jgi:hypothetical protein